jgi:magnesium-transporting ATPase (P-type)
VQLVLLEGKATIANVVEAFKYFMIINVAKFLSVELLMYQRQNFNGQQFLYINYFSNIPLIGLIGFTGISNHQLNRTCSKDFPPYPGQFNDQPGELRSADLDYRIRLHSPHS